MYRVLCEEDEENSNLSSGYIFDNVLSLQVCSKNIKAVHGMTELNYLCLCSVSFKDDSNTKSLERIIKEVKLSNPSFQKLCIFEVDKKYLLICTQCTKPFLQRQLTLTIEPYVRKTFCSVEVPKTNVKLPEDDGNALQGYVQ